VWFVRRLLGHGSIIRAPAAPARRIGTSRLEVLAEYCIAPPWAHFPPAPWLRAGNA
jgi:hypothetical protein